ncbi:MAG: NADP-dependent oxidoreductase [Pseudomonadales bacterium]
MATYGCITLARPVEGVPSEEDFNLETRDVPTISDGQVLVRNFIASVDPGMRSILSGGDGYAQALKPGSVISGATVGIVEESHHPKFIAGDVVGGGFGWTEYGVSDGRGLLKLTDQRIPYSCHIGVLGVPGMTSFFGLERIAQLKDNETLLVTSAAGTVGATAGQLAKLKGCHVTGIAGSEEKCAWLKETCGFDEVINYKAVENLDAAINDACPDGIDVLFDNVGNTMIDRVIPRMKMRGRIVVSGQVADYNKRAEEVPGIHNTSAFITHRLRMEGLVVYDDFRDFSRAKEEMINHIVSGDLQYREHISEGIANMPEAFISLFTGESFGRRLVQLGDIPE